MVKRIGTDDKQPDLFADCDAEGKITPIRAGVLAEHNTPTDLDPSMAKKAAKKKTASKSAKPTKKAASTIRKNPSKPESSSSVDEGELVDGKLISLDSGSGGIGSGGDKNSGGGGDDGDDFDDPFGAGDDGSGSYHVHEMYGDWFLDYASYVILERAVPHINDGFKPVQRRIMHSLRELEDGRYNKVANVVGNTMKYHPHGDASIGDAMIQIGQKDLLIDTQGNWGNILTGDRAAAPRYIEARLSKFALDVVFMPKITTWAASYDGRNKEPVTFPVKFPLLLAQGVEGIAVGLSAKILPHNFNELIDASIQALRKKPFEIYPDFSTGASADVTNYNEGLRGGRVRVRARIEPGKRKGELYIREIPFGTTTSSLIDSIVAANEKGKIKVSRIEDNTAEDVEIFVGIPAGIEHEQMVNALYAFTDCEVSIAPNCCVIRDNKPEFLSVKELLKQSAFHTRDMLKAELEVKLTELEEKHLFSSLEKIFIENRIYRRIEECTTYEDVIAEVWTGLKPFLNLFYREITDEDVERLLEIRIKRISKYDSFKADEQIRGLEESIEETRKNIKNITRYTVAWFKNLKKKYGVGRERKTVIAETKKWEEQPEHLIEFEMVSKNQVAVASETLYRDDKNGFAGYGIKRGDGVVIGKCSRLDFLLIVGRDGALRVTKVDAKVHTGKNPAHVALFDKEKATTEVFNLVYRDGRQGKTFVKRFRVGGLTREKVYELTQGNKGSRVLHLSNHETEKEADAEDVVVHLKPKKGLRNKTIAVSFGDYALQTRGVRGVTLTPHSVEKVLKG